MELFNACSRRWMYRASAIVRQWSVISFSFLVSRFSSLASRSTHVPILTTHDSRVELPELRRAVRCANVWQSSHVRVLRLAVCHSRKRARVSTHVCGRAKHSGQRSRGSSGCCALGQVVGDFYRRCDCRANGLWCTRRRVWSACAAQRVLFWQINVTHTSRAFVIAFDRAAARARYGCVIDDLCCARIFPARRRDDFC